MIHPRITHEFENEMLELIDQQAKFTRSDLQGIVTVLVNKILEAGQNLPANKITPSRKFYVLDQSPAERRPEVMQTFASVQEARKYIVQSIHVLDAKTVMPRYSVAQGILL